MLLIGTAHFFAKATCDVKATVTMRIILTKTGRHFAINGAIDFTFTRHTVKISTIHKEKMKVCIF